jgi:hypothetical protein
MECRLTDVIALAIVDAMELAETYVKEHFRHVVRLLK